MIIVVGIGLFLILCCCIRAVFLLNVINNNIVNHHQSFKNWMMEWHERTS